MEEVDKKTDCEFFLYFRSKFQVLNSQCQIICQSNYLKYNYTVNDFKLLMEFL